MGFNILQWLLDMVESSLIGSSSFVVLFPIFWWFTPCFFSMIFPRNLSKVEIFNIIVILVKFIPIQKNKRC